MEGLAEENERLRRRLAEIEEESRRLAARLQDLVTDSEARFSAIFRDSAVGILLLDPSGRVAMANPAAARILGYTQNDLRGTAASELWRLGAPDDDVLFHQLIAGHREKYRLERRTLRGDGAEVWVSLTVSLIRGAQQDPEYALAMLEDITERKIAEERALSLLAEQAARAEAESARRRISFLAEASVALSASLDPNATLSKLARLAVPLLGDYCLVDALEGNTLRRVAEAATNPALEEVLRRIPREPSRFARGGWEHQVLRSGRTHLVTSVDGQPLTAEGPPEQFDRVGGAARPAAVLVAPLRAAERSFGVLVLGRIATSRPYTDNEVALAEELARRGALAIDNARLYQEAMEANRLKDDFLAIVSHELRTPLTPILGWTQILRTGKNDGATLKTGLEMIERNARTQVRLVDDLLDVSRIISGKLLLETRPLALAPVVREAIAAVRPAADAKDIRLTAELDEAVPKVMGDSTRLLQVGWNLLSNAIKFTPRGGRVEVTLFADQGRVALRVADTGEGIDPAFLPHLFERFRQSEAAATRKHGGLGLGLSIVQKVVELHGGSVQAYSPGLGQGAVFLVHLPLTTDAHGAPKAPQATSEQAPPTAQTTTVRLDGLRALVVDDQPDTLALIAKLLSDLGAQVRLAGSAADAFAALQTEVPDVLVSDIGMPGEDGYSLIRRIRQLPAREGGRVPAIALTAFARAEDRVRALEAGFQSHVTKPVEPAELAAVVASLVPKSPKRKSATKPRARRRG
ncbi:MAG: ATP-binding protein [Myxococcota bacterium]